MRRAWWGGRGPITVIVAVCTVVYMGHGVVRFVTFHAPAYDLGFFDQLTSNLSTGRGWSSSFVGYDFRGQHWEPVLLVWAQLYRLVPTPIWLLVIDGVALALAPLAAWRLARRWFGAGHPAPLIAALATALSPLVLRTAGFDYHSEALTPLLALLALEAASRRRWLGVAAACAVLILLKEDAFLVVAGIGWLIWRVEGRRGGLLLTAAALAGFVVVVGVYMPGLRGGSPGDLLARYAYLGADGHANTPFAVLAGMVSHPTAWLGHLVTKTPLEGLGVAFLPLALLPLLSGSALVAVVPALAVALLSADPFQSSLQLHYGAEVFPLLLACALVGWRRAQAWGWINGLRGRGSLSVLAVAGVIVVAPLNVSFTARADDLSGGARVAAVQSVLDQIPAGVAVSASTDLLAHLSERPAVAEFPDVLGARWVVIDTIGPPSAHSVDAGYGAAVAQLPGAFHVVASGGGVVLWQRS